MKWDQPTDLLDEEWKSLKSVDEFGNVYYGTSDEGLTLGWLHYVCRVAPQLDQLMSEAQFAMQHPFWDQLRQFNGFNLFENRFALYGAHAHEEMNEAAYPYDWLGACDEHVAAEYDKFGDITAHLTIGYIDRQRNRETLFQRFDGTVLAVDLKTQTLVNEWADLDDLIVSQVNQLKSSPPPKDWIELI